MFEHQVFGEGHLCHGGLVAGSSKRKEVGGESTKTGDGDGESETETVNIRSEKHTRGAKLENRTYTVETDSRLSKNMESTTSYQCDYSDSKDTSRDCMMVGRHLFGQSGM